MADARPTLDGRDYGVPLMRSDKLVDGIPGGAPLSSPRDPKTVPTNGVWSGITAMLSPGTASLPTPNPFEVRTRFPSFMPEEYTGSLLNHPAGVKSTPSLSKRAKVALCGLITVLVSVAIGVGVYFSLLHRTAPAPSLTPYQQACTVFCQGPLLASMQLARLWNDSKTFVDMPLTVDPEDVLQAFSESFANGNPTRDELQGFLNQYFLPAGNDTRLWPPEDYQWQPPQLNALRNESLREFALNLNDLWLQLGRKIIDNVRDYPQRYSLVWQPNLMIVPGGRFLESYYWDSLWVILGLLRSNMDTTAMGVALNLVHMLDTFGFVPNGGRIYYALPGRSQPPLLSEMVKQIYYSTGNHTFLAQVYPSLLREYAWWMQTGEYGHAVSVTGGDGVTRVLNRYVTDQHTPRPESWVEDVETVHEAGFTTNSSGAQVLYSEIAAAAETGWDFSSRWFADGVDLTTCDTSFVIPVELNAILYGVEQNLAEFSSILARQVGARCAALSVADGDVALCDRLESLSSCNFLPAEKEAGLDAVPDPTCVDSVEVILLGRTEIYSATASARLAAIESLLWDPATAQWRDLRVDADAMAHTSPTTDPDALISDRHGQLIYQQVVGRFAPRTDLVVGVNVVWSNITSASNFAPLWTKAYSSMNTSRVLSIVASLNSSGLVHIGGIATTTSNTTQQWDFPNGWSPIQHMLILGLNDTGVPEAQLYAKELARRWVLSNLVAYNATGFMHEKYDVTSTGGTGSGGEYSPQVGFGWTNGAALDLLCRYDFADLDETFDGNMPTL